VTATEDRQPSWRSSHDVGMSAPEELLVGCVLLVLSGWWWFDSRRAIWHG
jgi:hypothetical protein